MFKWPVNSRIVIDISASESQLWNGLRSKTKNMIRKGERDGHVFISGDAQTYWRLHAERMEDKGQKSQRVDGQIFTEEDYDGIPIGGAVIVFDCLTAHWVSGAMTSQWLIWQIIRHCKRHGIINLDLGQSRTGSGSYKFKTHLFDTYEETITKASAWKMLRGFLLRWL